MSQRLTVITLYRLIQYSASSLVGHVSCPDPANFKAMCFGCLEKVIPKRFVEFLELTVSDHHRETGKLFWYLWKSVGMLSDDRYSILPRLRLSVAHTA